MRLRPARSLDDYDRDDVSGWQQRESRKDRRRRKRDDRRERGRHVDPRPRREPVRGQRAHARRREEEDWIDDGEELVDLFEEGLDEMQGVRSRRAGEEGPWSRAIRLSRNMRIQAAKGYRAAVMELRPGLYLVAEIPDEVARSQFGFAPMLAPLMLRSAARVIHPQRDAERRGLFRRREPIAMPGPTVPLLPGPVAEGMPVPQLGWADADEVAEVGCERCSGRCR